MTGRPSKYSPKVADAICAQIAEGKSLRTICADDEMPDGTTVNRWLREREQFRQQYARAKEDQADALAEEILDISDDGSNDWMEVHHGDDVSYRVNGEAVQRSKLRVEARKWLMGKLKPKKYGDRLELAGDKDAPLTVEIVRFSDPSPK